MFVKFKSKIYFKDFYIYLFIAIFAILCFCIFNLSITCINLKEEKKEALETAGHQIISKIEEELSQLNDFLFFLGKQISTSKLVDLKNIQTIINVLCDKTGHTSPFKGIVFDWISNDKKLIYKHADNIQSNFIDMSFRPYVKESQKAPWVLHLSAPAIGLPEGLWEIPGGMGIVNEEGHFLGILAIGVNIAEFNSRLQQLCNNKQISFIMLDQSFNIIFQSFDNGIDPKSSFYRQAFKGKEEFLQKEGVLEAPVIFNKIKYTYFKKIEGHPYTILLGYNKDLFFHEYIIKSTPPLFEIIFLVTLLTLIFYFLQRKKINLKNSSQLAQDLFRKELITSAKKSLEDNISKINFEKQILLREINNNDKRDYLDTFFTKICHSIQDIFLLSPKNDQFIPIDVNKIINECILIKSQKAENKGIRIYTKLAEIPKLKANELCFRQIIVGFISLCLEYTSEGGIINISTKVRNNNENNELEIAFNDSGLPLCRDDIIRLQNKFSMDENQIWDGVSSNYLFIESLVHMHFGKCSVTFPKNKGKTITITLPYNNTKNDAIYYEYTKNTSHNTQYH